MRFRRLFFAQSVPIICFLTFFMVDVLLLMVPFHCLLAPITGKTSRQGDLERDNPVRPGSNNEFLFFGSFSFFFKFPHSALGERAESPVINFLPCRFRWYCFSWLSGPPDYPPHVPLRRLPAANLPRVLFRSLFSSSGVDFFFRFQRTEDC